MPAFDVYRSVGPQVDVSLFGDAAKTGAALGQMIPNPVTSAIRGAQEGYKYGLDVRAEDQQNDLRQNQIEQLPVANQMQQAQLENEQAVAKLHVLAAQEADQTQQLAIQDQTALLQNRTAQNNQELQLRQQTDEFNQAFGNAKTPQEQLQILNSGKYNGVLSVNKQLLNSSLSTVYTRLPEGSSEKESVGQLLKIKGTQDYYQKLAEKKLPDYIKAETELNDSPLTHALTSNSALEKVAINDYPKSVDFAPAGYYETDSRTNKVLLNPDGSKVVNPKYNTEVENRDKYDVFSKDGSLLFSGKNDFAGITVKGKAAYDNYITQLQYQNGAQAKKAIQGLSAQQQSQAIEGGSPQDVPTLGGAAPQVNTNAVTLSSAATSPIIKALQPKLNLGEAEVKAIEQPVRSLDRQLALYASSASYRASPIAELQKSEAVTGIARAVSDAQFESNPRIQEQYTPAAVAEWNYSLLNAARERAGRSMVAAAFGSGGLDAEGAVLKSQMVKSPQDLYFKNQQTYLESTINDAVYGLLTNQQAIQEQPMRSQAAKNKNSVFLAKAASGRQ